MIALAFILGGLAFSLLLGWLMLRRIVADDWRAFGRVCLTAEGVKFFAFLIAAGAGPALLGYLIWNTAYLHERQRDEEVFILAVGAMILLGITQLSLHRLLGAKLSLELEFWKLKAGFRQGEDEPHPIAPPPPPAAPPTVAPGVPKP